MEIKIDELIIQDEIRDYLPTISKEEENVLSKSIKEHGVQDPLIVWKGKNILVDGHNRYNIIRKIKEEDKTEIKYEIKEVGFRDITEVFIYILNKQRARRNLTEAQISYIRGALYNLIKQPGKKQADGKTTSERIAENYGVSQATIERDSVFAKGIDCVGEYIGMSERKKCLNGEISASKKDLEALGKLSSEDVKRFAHEYKTLQDPSIGLALQAINHNNEKSDLKNQLWFDCAMNNYDEIKEKHIFKEAASDCILFIKIQNKELYKVLKLIYENKFIYVGNIVYQREESETTAYTIEMHYIELIAIKGNASLDKPSKSLVLIGS